APLGCAQGRESGGKCLRLVETDEIPKELQFTGIECCRQTFEEKAPKQGRELLRTKERALAGNPTLAIRRDAATRNDAVRMRIYAERRIMSSWRRDCCSRRPIGSKSLHIFLGAACLLQHCQKLVRRLEAARLEHRGCRDGKSFQLG